MAKILVVSLVFLTVAAATLLLWPSLKPDVLGGGTLSSAVNPGVFSDGIGIYVRDNNKYNLLVWRKKILGPEGAPQEQELMGAAKDAIKVSRGVRFYSYGLDFSKWRVVPPYAMAFCVVRDTKTVEGVFPIRIKIVDPNNGPIYELLPPPLIDNLATGRTPYLFWFINFQYSCNDGWAFKF